jgi:hypothetical protein
MDAGFHANYRLVSSPDVVFPSEAPQQKSLGSKPKKQETAIEASKSGDVSYAIGVEFRVRPGAKLFAQ